MLLQTNLGFLFRAEVVAVGAFLVSKGTFHGRLTAPTSTEEAHRSAPPNPADGKPPVEDLGGRHALAPRQQAASSIFLDGPCITTVVRVCVVLLRLFGRLDLLVVLLHLHRGRRDQVGRQPKQVDGRADARRHDGALRGGAHADEVRMTKNEQE